MALALNNLKRVYMPLNKETKPTNSIKKKEYPYVSQQLELYAYCLSNKQYVEGVQNGKGLLDRGR